MAQSLSQPGCFESRMLLERKAVPNHINYLALGMCLDFNTVHRMTFKIKRKFRCSMSYSDTNIKNSFSLAFSGTRDCL